MYSLKFFLIPTGRCFPSSEAVIQFFVLHESHDSFCECFFFIFLNRHNKPSFKCLYVVVKIPSPVVPNLCHQKNCVKLLEQK